MAETAPTRRTAEAALDQWNIQFRQSKLYRDFMMSQGLPTSGIVRLSRRQQAELERAMKSGGIQVAGGMHIDQGGNLNQKNRAGKIAIGVTAAATAAFGVPGLFPGLLSGGGAGTLTPAQLAFDVPGAAPFVTSGAGLPGSALVGGGAGDVIRRVVRRGAGGGDGGGGRAGTNWSDWLKLGGAAGIDLYNSYLSSRAANRRSEDELRMSDAELAYSRERDEADRAWERERFTGELGLRREEFALRRELDILGLGQRRESELAALAERQAEAESEYGVRAKEFETTEAGRRAYRGAGQAAVAGLGRGVGTGTAYVPEARAPAFVRANLPVQQPFQLPDVRRTLGTAAQPGQPPSAGPEPMVPMMAPDGSTRNVLASRVKFYEEQGAEVL